MKKLIVVVLVLLLVSMVTYGAGWADVGSTVRLTTTADKVGIGVTNPYSKLHVTWSAVGPTTYEEQRAAIFGYNSSTDVMYANSIGVFGKVKTSNGRAIYGNSIHSNGYGGYFVGRGYFSGNVGIGTDDPGNNKLSVEGTVRMTGFKLPTDAVDGYVLTSNANGLGNLAST